jgi:hypothetical protein
MLAVAQVAHAQPHGKTVFKAANGQQIILDTAAGKLTTPRSRSRVLHDCSNNFQTCLTDGHGFAFSYFRNCDDAALENYRRLRFQPKIISVLHGNLWMAFDASPKFMFHYVEREGLVGIYVAPTRSFDFRALLRKRDLKISDFDAREFRIVPPATIAACS